MKQPLIISVVFLCLIIFSGCKKNCKICETFRLKDYNILYPNPDPKTKCDYIILRKRTDKKLPLFGWIDSTNDSPIRVKKAIDPDDARKYVQLYNEKFNTNLSKTSFVDLDRSEMMLYLIDVMNWLNQNNPNDKSNVLRVYFGDRGTTTTDLITAIITTASEKGETYIENPMLKPLDWGSLCPPPSSCITDRKANLLMKAILNSVIIKPPPSPRIDK